MSSSLVSGFMVMYRSSNHDHRACRRAVEVALVCVICCLSRLGVSGCGSGLGKVAEAEAKCLEVHSPSFVDTMFTTVRLDMQSGFTAS